MSITAAYFSATNTTRKIVRAVAENLGGDIRCIDMTNGINSPDADPQSGTIALSQSDALIVGVPVYSGRVPAPAIKTLKRFRGSHTPAILLAVYGNRAYDDVFVELQDILEPGGFFIFSAGAFVARHSIFPHTASGRPDNADYIQIGKFCDKCKDKMYHGIAEDEASVALPGNRPYKIPGTIPLKVKTSGKCTACGACARACPAGAISIDNPSQTDYSKCIRCARCIDICPEHARRFTPVLPYRLAAFKFGRDNSQRKEPEFFFQK